MGKARPNFYNDAQGILQRYFYCDMCPVDSQPFTADQEYDTNTQKGLFITSGKHVTLCIPCAKQMGLMRPPEKEEAVRSSYVGPRKQKAMAEINNGRK